MFALPIYDIEPRWMRADGALYYHPIHPVNKAPISVRLAEAFSGGAARWPEIASVSFAEGKAVCRIAHAGPGMRAGPYRGFTLAGKDGKYYPARAVSAGGDTIEVTSEDAAEPAFLTYAFTQYQDFCDAASADGAPLLPYRTERGAVEERYCFPPAFLTPGADKVRENCFGWQVGTCRKADVWKKGEIYDASEVAVTVRGDAVILRAVPDPKQYLLFGVSPAICLSGHNHHIADYRYWNFTLSADGTAEFLGVVARAAGGEVFRFRSPERRGKDGLHSAGAGRTAERFRLAGARRAGGFRRGDVYARGAKVLRAGGISVPRPSARHRPAGGADRIRRQPFRTRAGGGQGIAARRYRAARSKVNTAEAAPGPPFFVREIRLHGRKRGRAQT